MQVCCTLLTWHISKYNGTKVSSRDQDMTKQGPEGQNEGSKHGGENLQMRSKVCFNKPIKISP